MKIIYIRTSTEDQDPKNQLADCKTLFEGPCEIVEEKQSAFKDKDRPKFETIVKRIKKKGVTDLYCWDWDRLFRDRKKLIDFFKICDFYNCKIHSFRQKFYEEFYKIPTPFDEIMQDLVLNLLGWMAEDESQKKSDRVNAAFKRSTKKWGRKPLKNIDQRILELHKDGKSMRDIASLVYSWTKQRNKKFVSKSYVHKIIKRFEQVSSCKDTQRKAVL